MILYVPKYQNSGKLLYEPYIPVSESTSTQAPVIQEPLAGKELEEYEAKKAQKAYENKLYNLTFVDLHELGPNHPMVRDYHKLRMRDAAKYQPTMRGISDAEAERLRKQTEAIENPDFSDNVVALLKKPARYISNPLKLVGDIHSTWNPMTPFPTTDEDTRKDREAAVVNKYSTDPETVAYRNKLYADKQQEMDDISLNMAIEAGTLGLGTGYNTLRKGFQKVKNKAFIPKVNPEKSILDVQKVPSSIDQSSLSVYPTKPKSGILYKQEFDDSQYLKNLKEAYIRRLPNEPGDLRNRYIIDTKAGFRPNNVFKSKEEAQNWLKKEIEEEINSESFKNMKIIREGNAYFKALDNPESLKRIEEFGKEYGIDLKKAYEAAKKRWEAPFKNIVLEHPNFHIKDTDQGWLGLSTYRFDLFNRPKGTSTTGELSMSPVNYINSKADIADFPHTVWHELSHDINKHIINNSPKLKKELDDIFISMDKSDWLKVDPKDIPAFKEKVKLGRAAAKKETTKSYRPGRIEPTKNISSSDDNVIKTFTDDVLNQASKELDYIKQPTETWAFLSTNLRQSLKEKGLFKSYNDILTPDMLDKMSKAGDNVWARFEPYVKNKDKFIKLFNKMTLATVPAIAGAATLNK